MKFSSISLYFLFIGSMWFLSLSFPFCHSHTVRLLQFENILTFDFRVLLFMPFFCHLLGLLLHSPQFTYCYLCCSAFIYCLFGVLLSVCVVAMYVYVCMCIAAMYVYVCAHQSFPSLIESSSRHWGEIFFNHFPN